MGRSKTHDRIASPSGSHHDGDPSARGQGVGSASTNAVISYLEGQGEKAVYTRCLTNNSTAIKLLEEQGFQTLGDKYIDENGLEWQNSKCDLNR